MLINILPIKGLLLRKEWLGIKKPLAAVLCSSYTIDAEKFDWISNKLMLSFADTADAGGDRAFTQAMAEQIKAFVDSLNKASLLYFCCDSGESRSTAIAAATYRYMNKDEMIVWRDPRYHPNPLVYRIMCRTYGLQVTDEKIDELTLINRMEFRNAVKNSAK